MAVLYYIHDPMCSWCWAFRDVWNTIVNRLPPTISTRRLLGGLAPDTELPMPEETRRYVQNNWHKIEQVVPGVRFNYDFWQKCQPQRATYPACRAVIAAKRQAPAFEEAMILAIQEAYYLYARNPSEDDTLIALAEEIGLERTIFADDLNHPAIQRELVWQIAHSRQLGARGFPSLILQDDNGHRLLTYDYRDPFVVLEQL